MKLELLVIAGQTSRGEYVLKSCTQNKMRQAVYISSWLKSNFSQECENSERVGPQSVMTGLKDPSSKEQPNHKKRCATSAVSQKEAL